MNYFANHRLVEGDYQLTNIEILENIGNGNSAVYSARISDRIVAIKQTNIKSEQQSVNVRKEIELMRKLSLLHDGIIKYQGCFFTVREIGPYNKQSFAYIVMEKGITSLESYLQRRIKHKNHLKIAELTVLMSTLIKISVVLQKNNVAHCDIKPENMILMNVEKLEIKICDIGSSRVISKQETEWGTLVGTVPFLAPELIRNYNQHSVLSNPFKSDVFSLGLCLIYFVTFKKFKSSQRLKTDEKVYKEILSQWIREARELTLNDRFVSDLLEYMLEFDEKKRIEFTQLESIFNKSIESKENQRKQQIKWVEKKLEEELAEKQQENLVCSTIYNTNIQISPRERQRNVSTYNEKVLNKTGGFNIRRVKTPLKVETKIDKKQQSRYKLLPKLSIHSPLPNQTTLTPFIKKLSMVTNLNDSESPTKSKKSSPEKVDMTSCFFIINKKNYSKFEDMSMNWEDKVVTLNHAFWDFGLLRSLAILVNHNFKFFEELQSIRKINGIKSVIINMNKFKSPIDQSVFEQQNPCKAPLERLSLAMKDSQSVPFRKFFKYFIPKSVTKLNISLSGSDIQSEEILKLVQQISQSQCEKLILDLRNLGLDEKHNKSIMELLAKPTFSKLTKLILHLEDNNINYSSLGPWPLNKSLQCLVLSYRNNKISVALNSLCLSLIKTQISELNLDFCNCHLTSRQINFLFTYISKLPKLETLVLNLSQNRVDDSAIKYMCSKADDIFLNIQVFQLDIYGTEVTSEGWAKLINLSDRFFSNKFKMNHFKISYDRFTDRVALHTQVKLRMIVESNTRVDLICVDNSYFTTYIRRKQLYQIRPLKKGFCSRLHADYQGHHHFVCLTCKEQKELAKQVYLCAFCANNCSHRTHNTIRSYDYVKCSCAFSSKCNSDVSQLICSNNYHEQYQKGFCCLKCNKEDYCLSCIAECKKDHEDFVKEYAEPTFFVCRHEKFAD